MTANVWWWPLIHAKIYSYDRFEIDLVNAKHLNSEQQLFFFFTYPFNKNICLAKMTVKNPFSIKSFNFRLNLDFLKIDSITSHFNFESSTVASIKQTLTIEKIKTKVVQPFRHHCSKLLIDFINFVLIIWSLAELVAGLYYFMNYASSDLFEQANNGGLPNSTKHVNKTHMNNFLNHLCKPSNDDCQRYLDYGLLYRVAAAALLLAGTIFVSSIHTNVNRFGFRNEIIRCFVFAEDNILDGAMVSQYCCWNFSIGTDAPVS